MTKLILPAFAALALFFGSASVQAQYPYSQQGYSGYQHHQHQHQNYGSSYNAGYGGGYARQSYYPSSGASNCGPQGYSPSNYYGSQSGYYGQSPYASPYQGGYQNGYRPYGY